MASLELSAGIMSGLPARVIFPGAISIRANPSFSTVYNYAPLLPYNVYDSQVGSTTIGYISIYSGSVPTDFSTLTLPSSRSADVLLTFVSGINQIFQYTVNVTSNPAVINTAYTTASASGTATWFRWYTAYAGTSPTSVVQQIIGTVGATGSGADLEIPTTALVSGTAYRIQNLRIQFPSSWSY